MAAVESRVSFTVFLAAYLGKALPYLILVFVILHLLYNKYRPGLRSIPGPTLAAWTSLWRFYDVAKGQAHQTHIRLHEQYGDVVRIGPNHVSVRRLDAIKTIYGVKNGYTKSAFYPIQSISWQKQPQMNLFSTRDETYHSQHRRMAASEFTLASVLKMEPQVDSCSKLFVEQLEKYADQNKPVDFGEWLQYYAFDVVGELSFGKKLGFLQSGSDVEKMMQTIAGILDYAALCGQMPEWHRILLGNPLIIKYYPASESWNSVLQYTLKNVGSILNPSKAEESPESNDDLPVDTPKAEGTLERNDELPADTSKVEVSLESDDELPAKVLNRIKNRRDMLSQWLMRMNGGSSPITKRDIVVHLSTNVFAGSDTTAIALRAIFYFLFKHPEKMRRLVKEIDDADAENKLSEPVQYREAEKHLPYLGAVIQEAMRLHSSVGLLMERIVPRGGLTIDDHYIPAGTVVGINPWVAHHDERVFKDAHVFKPERWLVDQEEKTNLTAGLLTFGAGSRMCVGRHISMMEMTKVVPQLLREFTIELDGEDREWTTSNRWFVQQKGLICRVTRRDTEGANVVA